MNLKTVELLTAENGKQSLKYNTGYDVEGFEWDFYKFQNDYDLTIRDGIYPQEFFLDLVFMADIVQDGKEPPIRTNSKIKILSEKGLQYFARLENRDEYII